MLVRFDYLDSFNLVDGNFAIQEVSYLHAL